MALAFTATATSVPWSLAVTPPAVFNSVSIGAASSDRIVVVCIGVDGDAGDGVVSGVTIDSGGGPVAMTQAVGQDPTSGSFPVFDAGQYIFYKLVTSGTTANISVACSGFPSGLGISVGIITGDAAAAVSATQVVAAAATADPHAITASVPANGVGIVAATVDRAFTPSWTNATGDTNNNEGGGNDHALLMAHGTSSSPSFTGANNFGVGMVMGTFRGGGDTLMPQQVIFM